MSGFEPEPTSVVAELVAEYHAACERGDREGALACLDRALDALVGSGAHGEAIELCVGLRQYRRAADIALSRGALEQAAGLYGRAGEFVLAAQVHERRGEPMRAAENYEHAGRYAEAAMLFEAQGDYTRAARLFERLGERRQAADLLRRVVMHEGGTRISGAQLTEVCRQAGQLYHELGEVGLAIDVLRRGNQTAFASKLLADAGDVNQAIKVLVDAGDYLAAADVARSANDERRAQLLLAERAENEGRLSNAAQHQEQAGEHIVAARLYEFAGELVRAASTYEAAGQYEVAARIWTRVGDTEAAQRCFAAEPCGEDVSLSKDSIREYLGRGEVVRAAETARCMARAGAREFYDDALAIVESVGQDHPEYVPAQALLAEVLEESGHPGRALSVLQRLFLGRRPEPEHAPAMYLYGRLLEAEGYLAGARNAFAAVAAFDPDFRDVKARLHLLREVDRRTSTTPRGVPVLPVVVGAVDEHGAPEPPGAASTTSPPARSSSSTTMDLFDQELAVMSSDLRIEELSGQLAASSTPSEGLLPLTPEQVSRAQAPTPRIDSAVAAEIASRAASLHGGANDASSVEVWREITGSISNAAPTHQGAWARPDALVGMVLRGRFRIEKKVGRGAQAQVYLARDQVLDRQVAIKVLNENVAQEDAALDRFLREARLAARVHHSGCIAIFDFGQEHGLTFMAMEYFRGRTLRDLIKRGPLEPYLALRIARDVASALGAVHEAGIVHRDVKPTNVMVDKRGQVRLTDFGVARTLEDNSSSGMMVGTMKYMAPEQARGKEVDRRADIFSLGVVIYEMLTGRPPFGGTLDALIARVTKPPPPLPEDLDVTDEVRGLVTRCMAKRPSQRFESVQPLGDVLNQEIARLKRTRRRQRSSVSGEASSRALPE